MCWWLHNRRVTISFRALNYLANEAALTLCAINQEFYEKQVDKQEAASATHWTSWGETKIRRRGPSRRSTRTGGWMAAIRGQRRD